MPTSYTSLIGLALPVTGELSGTWGDVVNNYITNYLDSAVAGTQTISGTQTAVTLSVTNGSSLVTAGSGATGSAQFQIINCTGNPAGLLTITAPASSRQYIIINATSTSQSVKIVGTGPTTGVTLIAGEKAHVAWNGSDFVKIATTAAAGGSNTQVQYNSSGVLAGSSNLTFDGTTLTANALTITNNPTLNGGTANGVLYLNGSKVATSGSALTFDGTTLALTVNGGANVGKILVTSAVDDAGIYISDTNRWVRGVSGGNLTFGTNGTEKMRLDTSGRLLLGTTTTTNNIRLDEKVAIVGVNVPYNGMALTGYTGAGSGSYRPLIDFNRSRGTTDGSMTVVANQDILGSVIFRGSDGTSFQDAAVISGEVDGTPGANDMPGRLTFSTTPDGSTTVVERMRLDSSGKLLINATTSPSAATVKAAIQGASGADSYYQFGNGSGGGGLIGSVVSGGIQMYTYTGAFGSETYTERMRIDSSGNLGLGVTPSAWSGFKVLESTNGNSVYFGTSQASLGSNAYNDGAGWKYKTTAAAGLYTNVQGTHAWYQAASGTAGTAISLTQAMTLDANGNLLIGTTSSVSAQTRIHAVVPTLPINTTYEAVRVTDNTSADFKVKLTAGSSTGVANGVCVVNTAAYTMAFEANNTERARITSGGYFKASNTGSYIGSTASFHETVSNSTSDGVLVVESTSASYTSYVLSPVANRNTTNNTFYAIGYYNRAAAAYKFQVADSGNVTNTNGSYGTISDVKMKTDIVDAGSQWADIKAIRFRKFKMKDDPEQIVQLGVVAQEVEQTSPGLVEEHQDRNEKGESLGTTTKSVKTSVLLMKAAVALQEAMTRIEQLEAKVAALESKGA